MSRALNLDAEILSKVQVSEDCQAPQRIWWELTYACNAGCRHCYANAETAQPDELSTEECLDIVDQLAEMKVFEVGFTGGEPLLRKDFFTIAKHVAARNMLVSLATNGLLLSHDACQSLLDIPVYEVMLSLDGIGEVHDWLRNVSGCFDKVVQAVEWLSAAGHKKIRLMMVIHKRNYHQMEDMIHLAIEKKVWKVSFRFVRTTGRATRHQDELVLPPAKMKELARHLFGLKQRYADHILIDNDMCFQYHLDPTFLDFEGPPGCPCGRERAGITPNGIVSPCTYVIINAGDVRKEKFKDIWLKSPALNLMREIKPEDLKGKCSKCRYSIRCRGGCRASAFAYHGDILAPDPYCQRGGSSPKEG